jgi:hypothetical protein
VDEEVAVPSILKSALLWGMDHFLLCNAEALLYSECHEHLLCLMMAIVRELLHFGLYALGRFQSLILLSSSLVRAAVFMGVSSNTRYQIINGLERVVEGSVISKRVPQIALAFTVGIRFANNIYGGMQFVDWARHFGVQ